MRTITRLLLGGLLLLAAPASARADWFAAPFIGATFGGNTTHTSAAVGVAGGWMSKGWLGVEADLADAPYFFQQDGFLTSRRVTTIMGNVIVKMAHGTDDHLVVYVSGGPGMLRARLSEAGDILTVDAKKLAVDIGGGATWYMSKNVGLRGDVRYFRSLRKTAEDSNPFSIDFSSFGFVRASVGLAVRF